MNTTEKQIVLAQLYDKSVVREYVKSVGLIFKSEEVVHTDQIGNSLILKMSADRLPDQVFFNGEEYNLVKI